MKRKIKTLTTYIINDFTPEEGLLTTKRVYDEGGNILLQEQYYDDGRVELKVERTFDAENRLLEEKHFTDGEKPHQIIDHEYNAEGKIEQTIVTYQDGAKSITSYHFDLAAKSEEVKTVDENGNVEEKVIRLLDGEGRVLEESKYGEGETFEEKIKTSYSEAGRTLEKCVEKGEETPFTHFYDYEFDEEGRIKYAEIFDKEEDLIQVNEIDYDENGNQIEIRMKHYDQGWSLVDRYAYDEQNRVIKEERLQPNGDLIESKELRYGSDDYIEEEEIRNRDGVRINKYVYEFF